MPRRMNEPYSPDRVAKGTTCSKTGLIGCHVRLDPDTFEQVQEIAKEENTSFAQQIRCLVEWGLLERGAGEP